MSSLIYKKMSEVMKDIGAVTKDQKNTAQGFKFRGIDQFVNALYPALVKSGVFMAPRCVSEVHELKEVIRSSGKTGIDKHVTIMMEYDFFAEDGSKVTIGPIPGEGLDSGDKATNKALSASLKYALIQTFSIPTEDMAEPDKDTPEISKPTTPVKSATVTATTNVINVKVIEEKTPAVKTVVAETKDVVPEEAPKKRFGGGFGSKAAKVSETNVSTKGDLY